MKIETQQDHLEHLIVTLQELETLTHRGFNFDLQEYNTTSSKENLEGVAKMIDSKRPDDHKLKIIVLRTG
jgi:hypothetical protein